MTAPEPLGPAEDMTAHLRALEGLAPDDLLAAARRWCVSALTLRGQQRSVMAGTDALIAEAQHRLASVWLLVDGKRKTVAMDDLRRALGVRL